MSFVAYCFRCEKKVTAHTLLDSAKLLVALGNEFDVEVMHTSERRPSLETEPTGKSYIAQSHQEISIQ
jgi:hypothetical protein